jgi:hypothetical protein
MPVLDWIGKQAVVEHHREVPCRLLEPVPELSLPSPPGDGAPKGRVMVNRICRSHSSRPTGASTGR